MIKLTNEEARRFLLHKQGLLGEYTFSEKAGVMDYIRRVGSVQVDPIDVCGTSPELVLQARVQDFRKEMLAELLYEERQLIDFFDKALCIFPVEDWNMFIWKHSEKTIAEVSRTVEIEKIEQMMFKVRQMIDQKEFVFSKDLRAIDSESVTWDWGVKASLARVAMDIMYLKGELIVHHKSGRQKAYGFAKNHLPEEILTAEYPFKDQQDFHQQLLLRRIGAVGFLWNKASDAWIGIKDFKTAQRNQVFQALLELGEIVEVQIEDCSETFYMKKSDQIFLENLPTGSKRLEFLAPLDSLLWDRNLIREIFDFDYKWEIYTPQTKRKYGYYVLPVLYGDQFVGRVEIERKTKEKILLVKHFWLEEKMTFSPELETAFSQTLEAFRQFNNCEKIEYTKNWRN